MAYNWGIFLDTGLEGGTPNAAQRLMYVHTIDGSDVTGDGSHDNPVKSLQHSIDIGHTSGCDHAVCGPLSEGDFVNTKPVGAIIPHGRVVVEGSGFSTFNINNGGAHSGYGSTAVNGVGTLRNYGKLIFQNFTSFIGVYLATFYRCEFQNCLYIGSAFNKANTCLFKNSILGGSSYITPQPGSTLEHCTFINTPTKIRGGAAYSQNLVFRGNIIDATSTLDCNQVGSGVLGLMDFNHFVGTLTGKIKFNGSSYDNIEALKAANPTYGVNDIPSTTPIGFNNLNAEDYTLQESSALVKAAHDKKQIGAFSVAAVMAADDVSWVATGVDNTTTLGEAILTAQPTGTLEISGWQIAPKKRVLLGLGMPDLEQNPSLGEAISVLLAALNKPYMIDYEMQYSDDNITYNGTWLKVPVDVQPFHDIANDVGNSDVNFVSGVPISCKYVNVKITFRNNETPV